MAPVAGLVAIFAKVHFACRPTTSTDAARQLGPLHCVVCVACVLVVAIAAKAAMMGR